MNIRTVSLCWILVLSFLLAGITACDRKTEPPAASDREAQITQVRARFLEAQNNVRGANDTLAQVRTDQARLSSEIGKVQDTLQNLERQINELQATVTSLATGVAEEPEPTAKGSGSWYITILFVIVLCALFFFLFRRMTHGEDEDEENLEDEFLEENDLGTIRYPGTKPPANSGKKS